jgi:hypothetical protein
MPKGWPRGFSWTKGRTESTTNPDKTVTTLRLHSGPFLFIEFKIPGTNKKFQFYAGLKPTPEWGAGVGNEGDGPFGKLGRWLKSTGWSNLGAALRVVKWYEEFIYMAPWQPPDGRTITVPLPEDYVTDFMEVRVRKPVND